MKKLGVTSQSAWTYKTFQWHQQTYNNQQISYTLNINSFKYSKKQQVLNPLQDEGWGGGGGGFPVTSTNVGISPQNFLTFSFIRFCHTGVKC